MICWEIFYFISKAVHLFFDPNLQPLKYYYLYIQSESEDDADGGILKEQVPLSGK